MSHYRALFQAVSLAFTLAVADTLPADDSLFDLGTRLQTDDTFKQQFIGSFATLSEREPTLTDVESALLAKLAEMFEVNTAYAQKMLESTLTDKSGSSATFNYILGNLYFANEEYLLAEREYKEAIQKFPGFQRAWTNLGVLYLRGDDIKSALSALSKSIALGDVSPSSYGKLAYCHYQLKHYMSAEAAYTLAIMSDPDNAMWLEGKVEVLMDSQRYLEAIRLIDELIERQPDNALYWLAQSNAYLALDDYERAASNIEVARRMGAANADALYQLGTLYSRIGIGKAAIDAMTEAANRGPSLRSSSIVAAALTLQSQGDGESAAKLLQIVDTRADHSEIEDDPNYLRLQAALSESKENWPAAIGFWNRLAHASPLDARIAIHLARLESLHGDRDRAFVIVDRVGPDSTEYFEAMMLKSRLLVEDERYRDALIPLKEALRIRSTESLQNLFARVSQAAELRTSNEGN